MHVGKMGGFAPKACDLECEAEFKSFIQPRTALSSGVTALQKVTKPKKLRARELRQKMTPAEELLWKRLRCRRLNGLKFRRQQVIRGFIADFYCEAAKLVLEIDGRVHEKSVQKKIDRLKDEVFRLVGLYVHRVSNKQVLERTHETLKTIGCIAVERMKKAD